MTTAAALPLAAAACLIAWLFGPGLAMLRVACMPWGWAVALAPACSTAVLGSGAIVAQLMGVRWGVLAALGISAVGVGVAALVRRLAPTPPPALAVGRADVLGLGLGVLAAVVVPLVAAGSPSAVLQRWDALFHLSALRLIDQTGSASSLTLGSLSFGDGHAAIYPAGWHALAALAPGEPVLVLVLAATVTAALPWVIGVAVLAAEIARRIGAAPGGVMGVTGAIAGLSTATPMALWIGWGHIPNAAGFALVPGVAALVLAMLRDRRGWVVAAVAATVALAGMALAHPNSVVAVAVIVAPATAARLWRFSRSRWVAGRRASAIAIPAAATALAAAAALAVLTSPQAVVVTGYDGGQAIGFPLALLQAVTGRYALWPTSATTAVAVVAALAAIVAARRRRWVTAAMLALVWLLYIDAATGGQLRISGLWYSSSARLSVLVSMVALPVAGVAAASGWSWLRRHPRRRLMAAVAVAAVVALTASTQQAVYTRAGNVFDAEVGNPPQFVTAGERDMIATLPDILGDGAILGDPFSGAAQVYGLTGLPVAIPVAGQVLSADQVTVIENPAGLASDPLVCQARERLGIDYLYQDSVPYQIDHRFEALNTVTIAGAEVIASADTAVVLALPPC